MKNAIIVKNVTKKYKLYNNTRERFLDLITPKSFGDDFYALSNINFVANEGEVVGFIGVNGSGKSTLSNIIAGIVPETSGSVKVNGQVSLIAVAAGLKNDLSGRDNIELKLLMLGFNKEEIRTLEPDIIEFSELDKFIDQPVKSYSSGMKSRLGFAISVSVDPDILVIDEALSVGDKAFAEKSLNKMKEFKRAGKTMIFVSHSIGQMKQFCDKILWLEFGMVKEYGTVEEVIPKYEEFLNKWQKMNKIERENYKNAVIENQQKKNNGMPKIDINNFYKPSDQNEYKEEPISILGHIRQGNSYIYTHPKENLKGVESNKYKHAVYFIKRKASYNDELYYLLSFEPSAVDGKIGWMKASDISAHRHLRIDEDIKEFRLNGTGKAYSKPWGGRKDCIISDLRDFENIEIKVKRTDMVGSNIWYFGELSGEEVWIHNDSVVKENTKTFS